jgi:glycosyltransferase involved in cell wall biosynthesis
LEIQLIIPWGDNNGDLGATYNRLMAKVTDWVCFLDHDVLQLNPSWYHICLSAIERVGHRAGWITGKTNAIACTSQLCSDAPKNDDIIEHMKYAKTLHDKHGHNIKLIDPETMGIPFSGFMILTHKKAWEDVGGFKKGFLGVDNYYFNDLIDKDYRAYVMPGVYMYHTYHQKRLWNSF